jgi:hypothetical protein
MSQQTTQQTPNNLPAPTSATGSIALLVTDVAAAPVGAAKVWLAISDLPESEIAIVNTNAAGACSFSGVAPGHYILTVRAFGFEDQTVKNIVVVGGISLHLPVTLHDPRVQHSHGLGIGLLVRIETPQEDPGSNSHTLLLASLDSEQVQPVSDPPMRESDGSLLLTPSVNAVPDVDRNPEQDVLERVSYRGLSQTTNSSELDSMGNNQALGGVQRGEPHTGTAFPTEAVQSFEVNTSNYSARFRGAPGASVNMVSQHGSGAPHGTAFLFARDNIFDATNPFSIASTYNAMTGSVTSSVVKPEDLSLQWGGSVGGSVDNDKLGWFFAYDQQQRNFPVVSAPASPTFLPLSASQTSVLLGRGVTSPQISAALGYLAGLTGVSARTSNQLNFFPRLDWKLGERDRFSAEYSRLRLTGPATGMTSPVVARAINSIGTSSLAVDTESVEWMHFLTENMANEVRAQYSSDIAQEFAPPDALPLPQVSMGVGGITLGTPSFLPRSKYPDEHILQLTDTLTWVLGKHTLSAGAGWARTWEQINYLRYSNGAYTYNDIQDWISDYTYNNYTYNHGGAVDGVCNSTRGPAPPGTQPHYECFDRYTQAFGSAVLEFFTSDMAAFVEDNWKPLKSLTLTVGMRYEYEQLPPPQLPNPTLDAAFSSVGSTSVYPEDRNNFAPRLGLSWAPFGPGRSVIRLGYGVYYGQVLNSTLEALLQNTGLRAPLPLGLPTCSGSSLEQCRMSVGPTVTDNLGGYPNTFSSYMAVIGIAPSQYIRSVIMDSRFRAPMIQQGELDIEREFGSAVTVTGSYLLSVSHQLPNMVDVNITPAPSVGTFVLQGAPANPGPGTNNGEIFYVPYYQTRVNPNYGPVSDILSNIGGYYNAFVLQATRRLQHGLAFDASWTWSKAIDYGQTAGGLGVASGSISNNQFDPFQIGYDRGLSDFNFPHKLIVSMMAEPGFKSDNRTLNFMLNGWQWTPLLVEQSGYAYSYNVYGGTSLTGGHDSINHSGGAQYLPTVGRNTLRLPDTINVNMRLARHIKVRDHLRVELMAEAFNLINRQNRAGLVTTAYAAQPVSNGQIALIFQDATQTSTPFGQYTSSATSRYAERQAQLGIRFTF